MLNQTTTDKIVRYKSNPKKDEFFKTFMDRVNAYFKDNNISPKANREMIVKTIIVLSSWVAVYAVIMSDILSFSPLLLILAFTLLGYINITIAFNIVHDACHNAYSKSKKVNKRLGLFMNFIGGNSYLFTMMHDAHHAFVNIQGTDVTLETHGMFRFTPHEPYLPRHRWQHIYTPFLYALAMVHWVLIKDYKWFFGELHIGNKKNIQHPKKELWVMLFSKLYYYTITIVLPLVFLSAPVWVILVGWVMIHLLPGLTFALIFQCTHVYDGTTYPLPDDEGNIENNYAIHVLETTADFSRKRPLANWWMGCINVHVIHHILPHVCHAHYPKLTKILMKTADEFGLEYKENPSFWVAFKKHIKMLKHLSKPDAEVPEYGKSVMYN